VANSYDVIDLTSHGRGRWFEPSIAHSGIACKTRYSDVRWLCGDCWCAATVQQPVLLTCRAAGLARATAPWPLDLPAPPRP
jgi:hypothetical protein